MRKRAAKWVLLFTLATPTLFLGCPATIGLKVLDSMVSGAYSAAGSWGAGAMMEFLQSLEKDE
ncbi:MAG: hypothetical protein WBE26_09575 [Phycisphaerae bacterium]